MDQPQCFSLAEGGKKNSQGIAWISKPDVTRRHAGPLDTGKTRFIKAQSG
jgi:hypothetical protein